jgi:hypothetical protein
MVRRMAAAAVLAAWMAGETALAGAPAGATGPEGAKQSVPVTRVVLFSSGVGYFEHQGTIRDNATTELSFKTAQINDILKSLVVMDLGKGTVTSVAYPTKDPLARVLKSFEVDLTDNPDLKDLLNQLRGAEVKVWAPEALSGKVLGVEVHRRDLPNGQGVVEEAVLNIVVDGGTIQEMPLRTIQKLQLADAGLAGELTKALVALSAGRDKDKKPIVLSFKGEGERQVVIGYVVETPIWQTSYRLVLGEKEKPLLQGWAVVENTTDADWTNVRLSLMSGRPISFVQDLYTPLYVPRPVVQPELYASLRPQVYDEGLELEKKQGEALALTNALRERADGRGMERRSAVAAAAPAPGLAGRGEGAAGGYAYGGELARKSVESLATAQSVGELFAYDIKTPVTIARQRSAMLPIANNDVAAEKLSIYNMNVQAKYPLNGVKLKNTTALDLMAGPITVFDGGAYAGDARIDNLAPGEERLLSYALDLAVAVDASKTATSASLLGVRLLDGVLIVKRKNTMSRTYVMKNKAKEDKTVIVEHPVSQGWTLVKPEKPEEKTPTLYRFRVKVGAEKTESLEVVEERPYDERIAIGPASISQLDYWVRGAEASDAIKKALQKAITLKQELADLQKQIKDREQRRAEITNDQVRIRANIQVLDKSSQLYNKLVAELSDQETELGKLRDEIKTLTAQADAKHKELDQYLLKLAAE